MSRHPVSAPVSALAGALASALVAGFRPRCILSSRGHGPLRDRDGRRARHFLSRGRAIRRSRRSSCCMAFRPPRSNIATCWPAHWPGTTHLIAPDYPGFGDSSFPLPDRFAYTFDHLAQITDKFLEQRGIAHYALMVQDYGAPIGYRIASWHPERVTALIIQNGNAYEEGIGRKGWGPVLDYWKHKTPELEQQVADAGLHAGGHQGPAHRRRAPSGEHAAGRLEPRLSEDLPAGRAPGPARPVLRLPEQSEALSESGSSISGTISRRRWSSGASTTRSSSKPAPPPSSGT